MAKETKSGDKSEKSERSEKVDDLLPKKKTSSSSASSTKSSKKSSGPSPSMRRLMRIARTLGIFFGGFVTLVGIMSLVGFISDNIWVRLVVALLIVVGVPAFVADRFLKRTNLGGGLAMVADIFAIILLVVALLLVYADFASKPLLVREGDRYAKSGSKTMASLVYFLGGVSPVYPGDPAPAGSGSSSASSSASAPPATSASK